MTASRGLIHTAQLLIRGGADIHAKSKKNFSVLDMAVLCDQTAMLKMLLNYDFSFEER